jgi:AcrR family transcriptional regulator
MLDGMTEQAQHTRQRRRGEELETALLAAAWAELVEAGFTRMTMESVAARARTGVAVLYRRWPRKDDLVLAAIRQHDALNPVTVPDTGSLRGDLIALLRRISSERGAFVAVISAIFTGLQATSGLTPAQVREEILQGRPRESSEVFRRAHERGEIDLDRIPPAVLALPGDLMRHDILMTYQAMPEERILEIVDDIFLPLVAASQAR